ncbi:hypothetical protein L218DRAFT_1077777 [Marasmius fiardii PR-910]|nr:hypothetical protein L218DRAFT_1077777 [Marasmius fiardii PR-910]
MDNKSQSTFTTLAIPGELSDIIIDCCREDTPSLLACSLVCNSWLFRSRHRLFNQPQIQSRVIDVKNAASFRDILVSPQCTIIPHITSLRIRSLFAAEHTVVESLLQSFNSLPTLKLTSLSLEAVTVSSLSKFNPIGWKTSLTCLYLHCCDGLGRISSTDIVLHICNFVNNFEALQDLTLEYHSAGRVITFLPAPSNIEGLGLRLPKVQRFALNSAFKVFLPLFSKFGFIQFPSLTEVRLCLPMSIENRLLQGFLDVVCAPVVQVLEISIKYRFKTIELFFPAIDVIKFKQLRSILFEIGEVTVFQDDHLLRYAAIVDGVSTVLSRVRGVDQSATEIVFGTQFPFTPPQGLSQAIRWKVLGGSGDRIQPV